MQAAKTSDDLLPRKSRMTYQNEFDRFEIDQKQKIAISKYTTTN